MWYVKKIMYNNFQKNQNKFCSEKLNFHFVYLILLQEKILICSYSSAKIKCVCVWRERKSEREKSLISVWRWPLIYPLATCLLLKWTGQADIWLTISPPPLPFLCITEDRRRIDWLKNIKYMKGKLNCSNKIVKKMCLNCEMQ